MRRPRGVGMLVMFLALWGGIARAQAQDASYREVIASALSEYGAGNFAEARALFLRAHDLQPSARTLRGIGMAAFEMRAYVDATRSLTAALADPRRPLDGTQRTEAQAVLDRAVGFVGRYTVTLDPPDAVITVDGRPAAREPDGILMLDIGTHTVGASAPERREASMVLEVRGGEQQPLELRLQAHTPAPLAPPPPASPPAAPVTPPVGHDDGSGGGGGALRPILLTGAGVLAAGAIITTLAWWMERSGAIDDCRAVGDRCLNLEDLEGQRTLAAVTTVTLAVGAVGLLVVGLIAGGGDAEAGDESAVACVPGACRVRF